MKSYHVIKLIYPMGTLKNLNLEHTFEQQLIPNGAKLILLGQKTFTWDLNYKGPNISVLILKKILILNDTSLFVCIAVE